MNYYEHHLGDFKKDAAHLTMIQEGAYRRLMDAYYIREAPLPSEPDEFVYQLAGAHSKPEKAAVDFVVEHFFKFDPSARVYRHKRCDEEIARFKAKSTAGKIGATARWSHSSRNGSASANGMRSHCEVDALQSPVSNPQSPSKPSPTPPYEGGDVRQRRFSEKDQALKIWHQLTASGGLEPPRDSKLQSTIDAVGGWLRIAQRTPIEEPKIRSEFCDAYQRVGA